jgi:hypothetical protein
MMIEIFFDVLDDTILDMHYLIGFISHTTFMGNDNNCLVFLCIQLQLMEWWNPTSENGHYFSHFSHQNDSLYIFDLCHASSHTATGSDDQRVTAAEMAEGAMENWGIHTLDTRYRVRHLNAKDLTLEKEDTVYAFRKF